MRIALIGYGRMGREVEAAARKQGETIARVFHSREPVRSEALSDVDICIDFSTPQAVMSNIEAAIAARRDIVVGTTGWYDQLPEIRDRVRESGLLYSANFSLGMNLFMRVAAIAARLVNGIPDYDIYVHEVHHRMKADAPSGTALRLAGIILENVERKSRLLTGNPEGPIDPSALHVTSIRAGAVTGTHTVGFDSEADFIELRHIAKNRRGFALGALAAARWLRGRRGIFTMDDVEL